MEYLKKLSNRVPKEIVDASFLAIAALGGALSTFVIGKLEFHFILDWQPLGAISAGLVLFCLMAIRTRLGLWPAIASALSIFAVQTALVGQSSFFLASSAAFFCGTAVMTLFGKEQDSKFSWLKVALVAAAMDSFVVFGLAPVDIWHLFLANVILKLVTITVLWYLTPKNVLNIRTDDQ